MHDLAIVILAVDDLDRAVAFYTAAFGWPVRVQVPVYAELDLPSGRTLGLYQREGFASNTGRPAAAVPEGHTAPSELYVRTEDLDGLIRRLEALGAPCLSAREPRPWGDEAAYFLDPDRHVVAVARLQADNS